MHLPATPVLKRPALMTFMPFTLTDGRGLLCICCAACAAAALLAGCASDSGAVITPVGVNPLPENKMLNGSIAGKELAVTKRMVRAGDYSQVIPRLSHIVGNYPDTAAATEAHYFLGVTYYQIGGLREAKNYFTAYLERDAEGPYAEASRGYVAGLADERGSRPLTQGQLNERLDGSAGQTGLGVTELEYQIAADHLIRRIEEVKVHIAAEPENLSHRLELADLYWKISRYKESAAAYAEILKKWPQLKGDVTINRRLELKADGTYTVLTPIEVERRNVEAEPLLVVNTSSFRSGRQGGAYGYSSGSGGSYGSVGKDIFYHVSGRVVNRGGDPMKNVEVLVTIYGFANLVYDTKTCRIGRLAPGAARAFSARFESFDNIENVVRYECVGVFDR